jgi:hypothetical protein
MPVNVELLKRTLEFIEANPKEWDQKTWCGTSCCFAGHAAILAGSRRVEKAREPGALSWAHVRRPDGKLGLVWEVAERELGLDEWQASELFAADNTLADLRRIVGELVTDEGLDAYLAERR